MSFPLHGFLGDTAATWDGEQVFIWGTDAGNLETAHNEQQPVYWGDDIAIWIIGPFTPTDPGILGSGAAPAGGGPAPKMVVLPRRRPRRKEEEPEPQPPLEPAPKIRKTNAQPVEALTLELPPDMTRQGLEEIVTAFRRSLETQEEETKARRRREDDDILTLLQAALAAGVFDDRH